MKTLKAKVHDGRLFLDYPTILPEGTALQLGVADDDYATAPEEERALQEGLQRSLEDARAGRVQPRGEAHPEAATAAVSCTPPRR